MFATLEAPSIAQDIRIECARGTESLCRPYVFDIQLTVTGGEIDLAEAVGAEATLRLARDNEAPQLFHGVLASVQLLVQTPAWALYQATLVPKVWHLGLTRRSRVFTKRTIPQIIEAVLKAADLTSSDFELRLTGDYPEEELVVQYQESDLDFLQRWMEHEGMYYFFEQTDSGAKMVVVDAAAAHDKMVDGAVRYHPLMGHDASAGACFDSFTVRHDATVAAVRLADYDYARPALDLSARRDVSPRGFGQMSLHGARFFDPSQADRYATLRAEELAARQVLHHASGTALHVSAGYLAELSDHPSDKLNTRYLATEVTHFVNQLPQERDNALADYLKPTYDDVYRVQTTFIDAAVQYRPTPSTPRARVWGFENGVVDGEADSPYAQLDDQGRYLVRMLFDESDLPEGKRSTYVRMMQPYGGTTEGFHFPLRKGTEVKIGFDGGDPDRPFIAGAIPNMQTPSPVTSDNASWNVIETSSSNRIRVNDEKDHEYIDISTPYDKSIFAMGYPTKLKGFGDPPHDVAASVFLGTQGTAAFFFGGDWEIEVSGAKKELIKSSVTEKYIGGHTTTVVGLRHEKVSSGVTEEYTGHHQTNVNGPRSEGVSGAVSETYNSLTTDVVGPAKLTTPVYTVDAGIYNLKAGPINVQGGIVSVSTGPVMGQVATVGLSIPGGVKITTPNWDVSNPNQTWKSAKWEVAGVDITWTASNGIELYGLKAEATAVKIEGIGSVLANKGINLYNVGSALVKGGPEGRMHAIRSELNGLTNFS